MPIASSSETVGGAATSCSGTAPSPPGLAKRMAVKTASASSSSILLSTSRRRSRRPSSRGSSAAAASGAHNRRMPRLVLQPAAVTEASTARRMRVPTFAPAAATQGAAASALASNWATSMPCPPACTCTFPGLSAASSARQAARNSSAMSASLRRGMAGSVPPGALRPGIRDARRLCAGSPRQWHRRC